MAISPYQEKQYIQSDSVTKAQQAVQNQQAAKPGEYQSQWQGQMNDVLGQIQNRDKFQYDINADALYQQAAQRYIQQGQKAMMDTMGQAAALTGGYGNSYAQNAGQQTYHGYLQGLTDMIPQFQQMALEQYQMEGDDLLNRYNLLAQQEESAYGRYQDSLNQYYTELDRLQGIYDSERDYDYGKFADDRDFDYGKYMDELNYQYQLDRDKVADDQWQKEFDENLRRYNQEWEAAHPTVAAGSGGDGGGNDKIPDNANASVDLDSVINLGYGPISGTTLAGLVASGQVTVTQDGNKITVKNNDTTAGKGSIGMLLPTNYGKLSGTNTSGKSATSTSSKNGTPIGTVRNLKDLLK